VFVWEWEVLGPREGWQHRLPTTATNPGSRNRIPDRRTGRPEAICQMRGGGGGGKAENARR